MATPALADEGRGAYAPAADDEALQETAAETAQAETATGEIAPEEETPEEIATAEYPQLSPVHLTNNSYFTLKRAFVFEGNRGKSASVTVTLHNGENRELKAADYWIRLENGAGDRYEVQMIAADKKKTAVAPKTSEDFTFVAAVGPDTRLNDLRITVFAWDFAYERFEKTLGTFTLPDDYDSITPFRAARALDVAGGTLHAHVERLEVLDGASDRLASVVLRMNNAGNRSVAVPNYRYSLFAPDGSIYAMEANGSGGAPIQSGGGRTVIVSGFVPPDADVADGRLIVSLADDGSNEDVPIAEFQLPGASGADALTTPANAVRSVEIGGYATDTWIDRVSVAKYVDKQQVSLYYNWKNDTNATVNVPEYGFMLRLKDGTAYPFEADGWKGVAVRPKEKREQQMIAFLPADVPLDGMTLLVYQANADGVDKRLIFPIALYAVDPAKSDAGAGYEATFTNADGMYIARVNRWQRLPWENKDQITVELDLWNESDASLAIPKLAAYFRLDGVARIDARVIQLDDDVLMAPKRKIRFAVLGNVPYGSVFSEIRLVLQEKQGSAVGELAEFRLDEGRYRAVSTVSAGEAHLFDDSGRNANIRIRDIRSYSSEFATRDIYYVQLEVENAEKRFNHVAKWAGYFKTDDDLYFPANISDFTQKLSPGGKVLLAFWSQLPKGYTWDRLQLLVGEAVTGSALTPVKEKDDDDDPPKPDGFVKAVLLDMPGEAEPKPSYKQLEIGAYTLSLSNIEAAPSKVNEMQLSFDYELRKNTEYETALDGHRLILEFESDEVTFTEELDLEKGAAGKVLQLGTGTYQIKKSVTDLNLIYVNGAEPFKLRLYDGFQGQRRLLAEQTLNWLSVNE
jgi:hypothetical protein